MPFGKPGKILIYLFQPRMENMRSVIVNQYAVFVGLIVTISADVLPAFYHQDLSARLLCKLSGCHRTRNSGPDYDTIVHATAPFRVFFLM